MPVLLSDCQPQTPHRIFHFTWNRYLLFKSIFYNVLTCFFHDSETIPEAWWTNTLVDPFLTKRCKPFHQCLLSNCCILNKVMIATTQHSGCDWCYNVYAEQKCIVYYVFIIKPKNKEQYVSLFFLVMSEYTVYIYIYIYLFRSVWTTCFFCLNLGERTWSFELCVCRLFSNDTPT